MPPIRIMSLNWDYTPILKITRRATVEEVEEVFRNKPKIIAANRRDTRSTHLAIGRTDTGRRLVVPFIYLEETSEAAPITCWQHK